MQKDTVIMEIINQLGGTPEGKVSVTESLERCKIEELITLRTAITFCNKRYGCGTCLSHNANSKRLDNTKDKYSVRKGSIKYDGPEGSELLFKFASRTTQLFKPDTIFLLKKNGDSLESIELIYFFISEKFSNKINHPDLNNEELTIEEREYFRRAINELYFEKKENECFRPSLVNYLRENGHKSIETEFSTNMGNVDITSKLDDSTYIFELKWISECCNFLEKIRMAIGQVIIYSFSSQFAKSSSKKLVIVVNEFKCDQIKKKLISNALKEHGINLFEYNEGTLKNPFD